MFRDRVEQITNTVGAGVYTLDGSVIAKREFSAAFADNEQIIYTVVGGTAWECNLGTLDTGVSPPTLTRDRLIISSSGSPIVWPDATNKVIFNDVPSEMFGPLGNQLIAAVVGGTANAITLATKVQTPLLKDGMAVEFEATGTPTGAVTAALNALAAKPVLHKSGDQATTGSWESGAHLRLRFDESLDSWIVIAGHRPAWHVGANIASAATLVRPANARDGSYHQITGTTTIANLWTGAPLGIEHEFVVVTGFTVTNGANLICPTGANLVLTAGDRFKVRHTGSNVWAITSVQLASGKALISGGEIRTVSGTTDTITAADNGRTIVYTNAGAIAVTVSALSALGADFRCVVINRSSGGNVTLTRSASDTFIGGGTAVVLQRGALNASGTRLEIFSADQSNIYTSRRSFRSAAQTIANAALRTVAHGLGAIPNDWRVKVRNLTAEHGYAIGDEIQFRFGDPIGNGAAASVGSISVRADATNVNLRYGASATPLDGVNATTGAPVQLTNANWEVYIEAEFG